MSCVYDIYLFMCMSRTIAEFVCGDLRKWSPLQSVKLLGRSDAFASDNKCSQTCVSLSNALSPAERHKEMRKVEARRNEHESLSLAQSEQSIRTSTFGSVLSLDNTHCCGCAARTHRALQSSISSGRFSRSQCVFTRNTRPPVLSTCTQYEHTRLVMIALPVGIIGEFL